MISKLLPAEKKTAAIAWNRAFRNTDPFGWPFSSSIKHGRIIFPTDGYFLSKQQFDALANSAQEESESNCYLVVTEGLNKLDANTSREFYLVDLNNYSGYSNLDLPLENSLFSITGAWGVMVSHEMHAIIGGSRDFIHHYNKVDKTKHEQWGEFKDQWASKDHKNWLDEVAQHIDLSMP